MKNQSGGQVVVKDVNICNSGTTNSGRDLVLHQGDLLERTREKYIFVYLSTTT